MRVVCVGGGPAGLYFAGLLKGQDSAHDVTVLERNPAGIDVRLGCRVLGRPARAAPERRSRDGARDRSQRRSAGTARSSQSRASRRSTSPGRGYAIGRRRLLEILATRAIGLGVRVEFDAKVDEPSCRTPTWSSPATAPTAGFGIVSAIGFETTVTVGRNKYIWLGTPKVFTRLHISLRADAGRLGLVPRVRSSTRAPAPSSSSAHRRPGPHSASTGSTRPRASRSWSRSSSGSWRATR